MTDPERLADGADLRATLLRSARGDVVPAGAKARHLAMAAGAGGAGAAGAAAASVKGALAKGAVVALLAAVALAGVEQLRSTERVERPFAGVPRVLEARERGELVVRSTPLVHARVESSAPVVQEHALLQEYVESDARLAEEVARLDHARSRLLAGDATGTLVELRAYERDFPVRQLEREATLLTIDALERSGDHAGATTRARAFIRSYPQSPVARRLSTAYE